MEGFSKTYGCNRLLYYESYDNVHTALSREKQLKGWRHSKKIALIESKNPRWKDFAEKWGREILVPGQSMKEFEQQTQRRIKLGDKTNPCHSEAKTSRRRSEDESKNPEDAGSNDAVSGSFPGMFTSGYG